MILGDIVKRRGLEQKSLCISCNNHLKILVMLGLEGFARFRNPKDAMSEGQEEELQGWNFHLTLSEIRSLSLMLVYSCPMKGQSAGVSQVVIFEYSVLLTEILIVHYWLSWVEGAR